MGFKITPVTDESVLATVKATANKRSERDTKNALATLLTGWLESLAADESTFVAGDENGDVALVCKSFEDATIFGWHYEEIPQNITDIVAERAAKSAGTERKRSEGWLGLRNPLQLAAKGMGLSLRFVPPSGETEDSEPFKQTTWGDTPKYGCITFRPYKERKKNAADNGEVDIPDDNDEDNDTTDENDE